MTKYIVKGGVYTDTTFSEVEPGTEEEYGPFDNYDDAHTAWIAGTFNRKLDICTHRLRIFKYF